MPQKSPLTVLFETEGAAIVDSWTHALHNLSGTHFAGLPLAELEEGCREALAAYRALIEAHDQRLLRQFTAGLVRRASEGFSLHEIQRALLLLKAIVRPRLLARYAHEPDLAAFSADWQRLEHAVDVGLIRLSEYFHRRATADLERQLARVNKLTTQLAELVVHDELTGLYNYRFFLPRLHEEVQRSLRYGHPLTLLMADLDYFKEINDTHGHLVGNAVLQYVGRTLRREVRITDIVARYGGEEFAIILPETDMPEGFVVAEHLRATVAARTERPLPPITISIGVSTYQADDSDGTNLIRAADQALYEAKAAGRNRIVLSE